MRRYPNLADTTVIVSILILSFVIMYRIFRPGIPASLDNPGHFIEAWVLSGYLIPVKHWFSGWVSIDFAGFPMFLYYPYPLGFFIIYLLQLLPYISLELAYKLIMLFSYALPAISLYLVSKKHGVIIGIIPAVFWILNIYVLELILGGMWSIALSMIPFIFFLADFQTLEKIEAKLHVQKIIKYSILLSSILLLHYYTFIISFVLIIVYILYAGFNKRFDLVRVLICSVILALLYDSFYLWNLLDSLDWASSSVYWGNSFFFGLKSLLFPYQIGVQNIVSLISSQQYFLALLYFPSRLVANSTNLIVVFAGMIGIMYTKEKLNRISSIILSFILLLIILGALSGLKDLPIFQNLQPRRFLIHLQVLFLVFMPVGIFHVYSNRNTNKIYAAIYNLINKTYENKTILLLIILLFVTSEYYVFENTLRSGYNTEEFPEIQNIHEMFHWIKNIGEDTRIYYQSTYESGIAVDNYRFDVSKFMPFAIYYTNRPSLGTWSIGMPYPTQEYIVTTGAIIFNKKINEASAEYIALNLEKFNSKYIVANTNDLKNLLDNSYQFELRKQFGRFSVYSLNNYIPAYFSANNAKIEVNKFENEEMDFTIINATTVDVKVQYHPYWSAFVDGQKVKIEKNEFNLMRINLPNDGKHYVSMIFKQQVFTGLLLSNAGFFILMILTGLVIRKKLQRVNIGDAS